MINKLFKPFQIPTTTPAPYLLKGPARFFIPILLLKLPIVAGGLDINNHKIQNISIKIKWKNQKVAKLFKSNDYCRIKNLNIIESKR